MSCFKSQLLWHLKGLSIIMNKLFTSATYCPVIIHLSLLDWHFMTSIITRWKVLLTILTHWNLKVIIYNNYLLNIVPVSMWEWLKVFYYLKVHCTNHVLILVRQNSSLWTRFHTRWALADLLTENRYKLQCTCTFEGRPEEKIDVSDQLLDCLSTLPFIHLWIKGHNLFDVTLRVI